MRKTLLAALVAIVLPAFLVPAAMAQEKKLKVGAEAPFDLSGTVEWVQGSPVTARDASKVYVLEFWATWCAPCKKSIPHLNQLYQDYNGRGLEIIGFSDEPVNTVTPFVKDKGSAMAYPVACSKKETANPHEKLFKAAGQEGIPSAFIVARSGKICYIGHPLDPEFERVLKLVLANRYDPELTERVAPTVAAARRAAKLRNYKEAERLYDQAFNEGPSVLVDIALENWRMISEQAGDAAGAKASIRATIDRVSKDKYALMAVADFLATSAEVKDRDLDLNGVDLLTLSACETAVGGGRDATGREIEGFGALAQRQGAKAVLATLWPVADESTSHFMAAFYKAKVGAGQDKSRAVQRVQVEMLEGRGVARAWTHPFHWAPFVLMGNWR